MQYKKITMLLTPFDQTAADLLIAQLGELGCDSFMEIDGGFEAYAPAAELDMVHLPLIDPIVEGIKMDYQIEDVPDQDWNEEWEKNYFEPVVIADRCLIRSSFHQTKQKAEYEIVINPKMAFGTGHHETTSLMIRYILASQIKDKRVLDMGCGTCILSILASLCEAKEITSIDVDDWCYRNSLENLELNNITNVTVSLGNARALPTVPTFDVILANINRNILLEDMHRYVSALAEGGTLIMSGFYQRDLPLISARAVQLGLQCVSHNVDNDWCAAQYIKHNA